MYDGCMVESHSAGASALSGAAPLRAPVPSGFLLDDRKALRGTLEDHEPRLLCIAIIMRFASRQRRLTRD